MKGKTLRRTVWCRQSDFENRLQLDAIRTGYHRADWDIVSIADLQARATWQVLRGQPLSEDPFFSDRDRRLDLENNRIFLQAMSETEKFARRYVEYLRLSKHLYNPNWRKWGWKYDEDSIKIRYRVDQPWAPLGLATLGKRLLMSYNIIDYADEEPVKQRIVKKQVWDSENQKFIPKTFIRMFCTTRQRQETETWLREHYGPPTYQGMWWSMHTSNEVWMNDALYTFWQLKYGNIA